MSQQTGSERSKRFASAGSDRIFFLIGSGLLLAVTSIIAFHINIAVLPPEAPPARVAEAARSLWKNGTTAAPEFIEIRDRLTALAAKFRIPFKQDAFSLGSDGRLYPKHSLISSFLAAPFYGIFGDSGFLLFQFLASMLLLFSLYATCAQFCSGRIGVIVLICVAVLSQTIIGFSTHQFGHDLHGALSLIGGLAVMKKRPIAGGALAALSVSCRPSNVLLLPFLAFAWGASGLVDDRQKHLVKSVLGMAVSLVLLMWINYRFYGAPYVTAYQRLPLLHPDGGITIEDHGLGLSWATFSADWGRKLFSADLGLLTFNPALWLLPWSLLQLRRYEARRFFYILLAGAAVNILYVFSYEYWDSSLFTNRLHLTSILLVLPATAVSIYRAVNGKPASRSASVKGRAR